MTAAGTAGTAEPIDGGNVASIGGGNAAGRQAAAGTAESAVKSAKDDVSRVAERTHGEENGAAAAERLAAPSLDIREINDRLDAVSFFADNPEVRRVLREALRHCLDMKRAVQRLSLGRGGPKDLYDLAATLKVIPALKDAVLSFQHYQTDSVYSQPPLALAKLANSFFDHSA